MAGRLLYFTVGIIVLAVILAAIVHVARRPQGQAKITVYVYKDFMAWGEDPRIFDKLVESFTKKTGIKVELVKIKGARQMVSQVISEAKRGVHVADVVVGVDPILLQELRKAGLVYCYLAPGVQAEAADALDPEHCATPIDYGLIALVYDPSRLNETEKAMLADGVTLRELVALAPRIVGEDPTKSSTGLNFLLYTIAASKVEGVDWRELWRSLIGKGMMIAASWGDAYDEFYRKGSPHAVVVSYGTDPAYSAWYNMKHGRPAKPDINATVLVVGGKRAGWLQVEGAVIVKGGNVEAAKKFVDWLVSREVQKHIPTSQWMLPVADVELPSFYKYALTSKDVDTLLNSVLKPGEVSEKLEEWLREWLGVAGGG